MNVARGSGERDRPTARPRVPPSTDALLEECRRPLRRALPAAANEHTRARRPIGTSAVNQASRAAGAADPRDRYRKCRNPADTASLPRKAPRPRSRWGSSRCTSASPPCRSRRRSNLDHCCSSIDKCNRAHTRAPECSCRAARTPSRGRDNLVRSCNEARRPSRGPRVRRHREVWRLHRTDENRRAAPARRECRLLHPGELRFDRGRERRLRRGLWALRGGLAA